MSPRGIVLFHDINVREYDFGVWKLWDELKADRPHFEFFHQHGLGVLAMGEVEEGPLRELLSGTAAKQVRTFFFQLGQGYQGLWERDQAVASLKEQAAEGRRIAEEHKVELGARTMPWPT